MDSDFGKCVIVSLLYRLHVTRVVGQYVVNKTGTNFVCADSQEGCHRVLFFRHVCFCVVFAIAVIIMDVMDVGYYWQALCGCHTRSCPYNIVSLPHTHRRSQYPQLSALFVSVVLFRGNFFSAKFSAT